MDDYTKNSDFWTSKKDDFTLIGDFLGRLPALELLNPQPNETILDAGCGTGFVTRMIAQSGSIVSGCDRNKKMLEAAQKENDLKININYRLADITKLPYENETFDTVICVGVLMHNSPKKCVAFLTEAFRVLKPDGKLLLSLNHPDLYKKDSPTTNNQASWLQLNKLSGGIFEENYYDINHKVFIANVWCHSKKFIKKSLRKSGFYLIKTQSNYVTKETLKKCNQLGGEGWPSHYQIKAIKAKRPTLHNAINKGIIFFFNIAPCLCGFLLLSLIIIILLIFLGIHGFI